MKKLISKYNILPAACFMLILFQSCISEDLSNCDAPIYVYFDYRPATYAITDIKEGIFPEDVTKIDLFIFDEEGKFVDMVTDESPQMSPSYYIKIEGLKSGNYTFIAWGSLKGQYSISKDAFIPGTTTIDEVEVFLNCIENDKVTERLSPLFFATHEENLLEVKSMIEQRFNLELIQDTYTFNVSVSGPGLNDDHLSEGAFQLNVADDNGKYKFDNSFTSGRKFNYIQDCNVDVLENKLALSGSISVMRLAKGRKSVMRVVNAQSHDIITEDNLIELLAAVKANGYDINLRYQHEFDIDYLLTGVPGEVQITINGWKLIKQDGNLGYY